MKKLEINDYKIIKPYFEKTKCHSSNTNPITTLMWSHVYEIHYMIKNECLILASFHGDKMYFYMPFGPESKILGAIDEMRKYAKNYGYPFVMEAILPFIKDMMENKFGQEMLYLHNQNIDDYVYEKAMLQSLAGKKMQKRRNHYNAFVKSFPNFTYQEITNIDEAIEMYDRWNSDAIDHQKLSLEREGIIKLLQNQKLFNLKTGAIYINGKLEAFTIASLINEDQVQIHVEKANRDIRGLYVAIGKMFLEQNYPQVTYVNREEDMGLAYLKKAKQALNPCHMIKKYTIVENQIHFEQMNSNQIKDLKYAWLEAFEDENIDSTNFYFEHCFKKENTYILRNNVEIISSMSIVPFQLKDEVIYFILGVLTKPQYQNRGYFKKLYNYVINLKQYQGKRLFLQAYTPEIYTKLGFKKQYFLKQTIVDQSAYDQQFEIIENNEIMMKVLYDQFITNFKGSRIRDLQYYTNYISNRNIAYDQKVMMIGHDQEAIAYAIFHDNIDCREVFEIIYCCNEALEQMISALKVHKVLQVNHDRKCHIIGQTQEVMTMMTNDSVDFSMQNEYFINELL